MNLILIEDKSSAYKPIKEAFIAEGFEISELESPSTKDFNQEQYLQALMSLVSQTDPVFIFSLDFIPFISLACGALNMPYVSWLHNPYNKEMFNPAIANPWNFVFVPDKFRLEQLQRMGVEKVYYLPLAPTNIAASIINENFDFDMTMWMDLKKETKTPRNAFEAGGVLRDSTVGYLDGLFCCVKQDFTHIEYSKLLPDYVIEDLKNTIPYTGNMNQYYDSEFFYPFVTYLDSSFYFPNKSAFIGKKLNLVDVGLPYAERQFQLKDYSEITTKINASKMHIMVHPRNIPTGISQEAWDIMAQGKLLISNYQSDFEDLDLNDVDTFKYSSDLYKLYKNYSEDDALCNERSLQIYNKICEAHTYHKRIQDMFSMID